MDTLEQFMITRPPTAQRPLLGLTVLAVEDSRYACEALRLLCLRSGARIRRADSLGHARRHLRTYRPNVLIVDQGLPDGFGTELIREIDDAAMRPDVILGTSGESGAADRALSAGADGFLDKPIANLGMFQSTILAHLPAERQPLGPRSLSGEAVDPDPLALRDDLSQAAQILVGGTDDEVDYVTQFLGGIARATDDDDLDAAVEAVALNRSLGRSMSDEMTELKRVVSQRLSETEQI